MALGLNDSETETKGGANPLTAPRSKEHTPRTLDARPLLLYPIASVPALASSS